MNIDEHRKKGKWIFAPISSLMMPEHGHICYGPSWWAVTRSNEVLFFDKYSSPLSNTDKSIVEHMIKSRTSDPDLSPLTPRLISMLFIPHKCSEYF